MTGLPLAMEAHTSRATIPALIEAADRNDLDAREALFSTLYAELHRLARRELARHGSAESLGVTTLLHEAYLEIAERDGASFPDRARFMGYAARVMRGLIIDHARNRHAVKRGGRFEITSIDTTLAGEVVNSQELADIGEALDELAKADGLLAQIVDLKFFCGFSFVEIAAMQSTTARVVRRKWETARIFLHRTLRQ